MARLICNSCAKIVEASEGKQYDDLFICKKCDTEGFCKHYEEVHDFDVANVPVASICHAPCYKHGEEVECEGRLNKCKHEKFYEVIFE